MPSCALGCNGRQRGSPGILIIGMLGVRAVGPSAAVVIFLLSTVLLIEPRGALMPFMVNSFKLLDERRVRTGRVAVLCVAAVVLGLAVALPVALYLQYDRGLNLSDQWANRWIPRLSFDQAVRAKQRLAGQGALEEAESVSGWRRFAAARPGGTAVVFFGVGLGLTLLFSAARLRLAQWPLHPVLFLVWTTGHARQLAASLFVGWLVKVLVTKYGGMGLYRRLKPLMFGLIAGDMLGGVTASAIGAAYYFLTGKPPVYFQMMAG